MEDGSEMVVAMAMASAIGFASLSNCDKENRYNIACRVECDIFRAWQTTDSRT